LHSADIAGIDLGWRRAYGVTDSTAHRAMLTRLLTSGLALVAIGTPLAAQRASAHAALLAADSALAATVGRDGLGAALPPAMTDDAHLLEAGQPLLGGRAAIARFLAADAATGAIRFSWRAIRADLSADGRVGYTMGYGPMRVRGDSTVPGGYAIAWRRGADGRWQVRAFLRAPVRVALDSAPAGFGTPAAAHVEIAGATAARTRDEVMAADVAFAGTAVQRGAGEAFGAWAAPDAAMLSGTFGPEAIRAAFAGGPPTSYRWAPVDGEGAASGELGWTVGTARVEATVDGKPRVNHTKYLTVWKRQPDGSWRWVFDGGNGSPAP